MFVDVEIDDQIEELRVYLVVYYALGNNWVQGISHFVRDCGVYQVQKFVISFRIVIKYLVSHIYYLNHWLNLSILLKLRLFKLDIKCLSPILLSYFKNLILNRRIIHLNNLLQALNSIAHLRFRPFPHCKQPTTNKLLMKLRIILFFWPTLILVSSNTPFTIL